MAEAVSIRPERGDEYPAVADIHVRAFSHRSAEATIVALLRQVDGFDPDLSLVAVQNGRAVGHALFSPYTIRLLGSDVPAVNLAPIAVLPEFQGRGIGERLIREGHERARAKGHAVSFLLGHRTYYPRFGYRTGAFGSPRARPATSDSRPMQLDTRGPEAADVPVLASLWHTDQQNVDFALTPAAGLLQWLSPNPKVKATVYLRAEEVVGYTRIHLDQPECPRVLLSRDPDAARSIVAALSADCGAAQLSLPVHPASMTACACNAENPEPWQAAMALSLSPCPLEEYLAQIRSGERPVGAATWPVAFDLA